MSVVFLPFLLMAACSSLLLIPLGIAYFTLRCKNCGRLPLASREDSGWPDFGVRVCAYCGAPR